MTAGRRDAVTAGRMPEGSDGKMRPGGVLRFDVPGRCGSSTRRKTAGTEPGKMPVMLYISATCEATFRQPRHRRLRQPGGETSAPTGDAGEAP